MWLQCLACALHWLLTMHIPRQWCLVGAICIVISLHQMICAGLTRDNTALYVLDLSAKVGQRLLRMHFKPSSALSHLCLLTRLSNTVCMGSHRCWCSYVDWSKHQLELAHLPRSFGTKCHILPS